MTSVFNEDIISEVWKHLSLEAMSIASIVSKHFYNNFRKLSKNERIYILSKNSKDIYSFITNVVTNICNKNKYKIPRFISRFNELLKTDMGSHFNDIIYCPIAINIFYYILVILTHTVNRNYKKILSVIQELNYKNLLKNEEDFYNLFDLQHILGLIKLYDPHFFRSYSLKIKQNIQIVLLAHEIALNESCVHSYHTKQTLYEYLIKYSSNYPKYFHNKLVEMFELCMVL